MDFTYLPLVGELRFKRHLTLTEITKVLITRGVATSERNSMRLYEHYLALLRASVTVQIHQELERVVRENKRIMLSMAGVQPEKRNETLYVVREVFNGTTLAAQNLKSGSASELKTLLQPIKDHDLPVIGLVSDGQHSIRIAMADIWPNAPCQYCQYHCLDIAKPVVDADRKLKTA